MKQITSDQVQDVQHDVLLTCRTVNRIRQHRNEFLSTELGSEYRPLEVDVYNLKGGPECGKSFAQDWKIASAILMKKGLYKSKGVSDVYPETETARPFHYIIGQPVPNQWTRNRHQQKGKGELYPENTLLLTIGLFDDGTIKKVWAARVTLTHHPDGKSGDWKFNKDADNFGMSSFSLTQDSFLIPSYQQIIGEVEEDFKRGDKGGDAKKNLKLIPSNLPA